MKHVEIHFDDSGRVRRILSWLGLCRVKYWVYFGVPDHWEPRFETENGMTTAKVTLRLLDFQKRIDYKWKPFWTREREVWEQDEGYAVAPLTEKTFPGGTDRSIADYVRGTELTDEQIKAMLDKLGAEPFTWEGSFVEPEDGMRALLGQGAAKTIEATFRPVRTDDLQNGGENYLGWRGRWRYLWTVDEEDGGPYVGQAVYEPVDRSVWFGWIPECDLDDIVVIDDTHEQEDD